ncbi:MAG: DUF4838 domain-containing protein [Bacteroidales bacterium]
MMKKLLLLTLVFWGTTSCFSQGAASDSAYIAKNQKSTWRIILPAQPDPQEERAAEFLNKHLEKITGLRLPIVRTSRSAPKNSISIHKTPLLKRGDDYRILVRPSHILVEGGMGKGCVYGIAEILERFWGVQYYSPSFVVIPQKNNLSLPCTELYGSSPNTYRNVHGAFAYDYPDYRDFHRLHTIEDMFANGYYVHTFNRLVPWQEYFDSHPEYFAWMNGKRIIDQLCLSNPEVLELVIKRLSEEMKKQPDKQVWSVSQNDNFSYCQCDRCKRIIEEEGSPAGPIIRFVNAVASHFPDKTISTLAYEYSRKAPLKTKPAPNVQVMLCTIELNRSKPIASDSSSLSFLKDMEDWSKISSNIYLWDYTVDFAHTISPFPNLHTLQPNIQLFVRNGIHQHFQQSFTGTGHEMSELKGYLLAKLLWNPNLDVDSLIHQFTEGYYGKAGFWIRSYIYHLQQEIQKSGEWLDIYGPPTLYANTFLSAANISAYNDYFDRAEEAVANDSVLLLHVKTARMALQYAEMEIGKADMFGTRGWYVEKDGKFILRKRMADMLESFYQTSLKAHASLVNESGLTCEDYYKSTLRFMDLQVSDNKAFWKKVTASPLPSAKYSGGDLSLLTNGVRGANDYKVHWLGWEGQDAELTVDLQSIISVKKIEMSTLWDPKSWILHPASVECFVSNDGKLWKTLGLQSFDGDQRKAGVNHVFSFEVPDIPTRYIKLVVKGTHKLFDWHPSAGGTSWFFVDEIVVR